MRHVRRLARAFGYLIFSLLFVGHAVAQPPAVQQMIEQRFGPAILTVPSATEKADVLLSSKPALDYRPLPSVHYTMGLPIGHLVVTARRNAGDEIIRSPCTAFMVSADVIMTAWHCLPGLPQNVRDAGYKFSEAHVVFKFDEENNASGHEYSKVVSVLESDRALDFALARIDRPMGTSLGVVRVLSNATALLDKEQISVVHHPYGARKLILDDTKCKLATGLYDQAGYVAHRCDTRGGSSGAPLMLAERVLDDQSMYEAVDYKLPIAVALHTRGLGRGLESVSDYNFGIRMEAIVAKSAYLQAIACKAFGSEVRCPKLDLARPPGAFFDFPDDAPVPLLLLDAIPSAFTVCELDFAATNYKGARGCRDAALNLRYAANRNPQLADAKRPAYLKNSGNAFINACRLGDLDVSCMEASNMLRFHPAFADRRAEAKDLLQFACDKGVADACGTLMFMQSTPGLQPGGVPPSIAPGTFGDPGVPFGPG